VFLRPDVERRAGDFVHERDRQAEAGPIDRLEIVPAPVTRVHPDMLERGRMKIPELALVTFAARGTEDAPAGPPREARRAQQLATAPFERLGARGFENRQLRRASAAGTSLG